MRNYRLPGSNGIVHAGARGRLNSASTGFRRPRIALYSHDTMGLGHMRRNLLIATTLAQSELRPTVLMIAGAREAAAFAMPASVDCVTLPAFGKQTNGQYHARSLDVSLKNLVALRANIIRATLESFQPDVLIVDKVPLGAFEELKPALTVLRAHGQTRCVLGLRDVLDDPVVVYREWHLARNDAAICDYYDAVWVYGDPAVYDVVQEYGFCRNTASKIRYTGYLGRDVRNSTARNELAHLPESLELPPGRLALCMVGGGQDGHRLADAFARTTLPSNTNGLIVTGPFMPPAARKSLQRIAAMRSRMRVIEFTTEPELLLKAADSVVVMGGYNTVCEALSWEKRTLIVPRVVPRREQLVRAERMRDLGLLDMLHPEDLTPDALACWLTGDSQAPAGLRNRIDLNGTARLPNLLTEVLARPNGTIAMECLSAG